MSWAAQALKRQINIIEEDILSVLKEEGKPLSQSQLFHKSKLEHISELGWSFAIDRLWKKELIEMDEFDDTWYLVQE